MDKNNKKIYFLKVAELTATLSKDANTKVGAVIVKNNKILSIGYNGPPRNFNDDLIPLDNNSNNILEKKNTYMIHAEMNAIFNYENRIIELKDSDIFLTISPCVDCIKCLAQIGIKNVYFPKTYKDFNIVKQLSELYKINLNYLETL